MSLDQTPRSAELGSPAALKGALVLPLMLHSTIAVPAGQQPISVGVPLPRGRVGEPFSVTAATTAGDPLTVQSTPLARWSDGSIKWLLVDFLAPQLEPGTAQVNITVTPGARTTAQPARVDVRESGRALVIDAGKATFHIDRAALLPFQSVRIGGQSVMHEPASLMLLTTSKGRPRGARIENVQVENRGAVRTTVFLTGRFPGRRGLRFRARLCFYTGTGLVCVRMTLHNPNRARHAGGLWDLGDEGSRFFRSLGLELWLTSGPWQAWFVAEPQGPREEVHGWWQLYQDSSGGENWQSRTHVNRDGVVPCRFQGYRIDNGDQQRLGLRASPTVRLANHHVALTASLPEFWQQFPKALEVSAGRLRVGLFPDQCADLFELQGGERKTHTLWLAFAGAEEAVADDLAWTHAPARAILSPEWYAQCKAIPYLLPDSQAVDSRLADYMQQALSGPKSLLAKREVVDEFGWRHYGDAWADHEQAYYDGPPPIVSHYNNQFDLVDGAIRQMLSTGRTEWFDVLDPLARHVMDIDIYHTTRDKAAYNNGMFWFTDHYHDAATATHRTFSRANLPRDGSPYGGGPGSEHNFATGLLHYYYLTGDPDAFEAVIGLADWVRRMDDGRLTPLGVVDDGPTGLASMCGSLDYHGPGRGGALSIRTLLDAWLLTRRPEYMAKAEELVRRSIHPEDDIDSFHLLDAEHRWSYTMFLTALARYLDAKAECGALDEMYAYAQQSLLHYARWMADHERPYLDRPEQLVYPTEAWAAQEMRKANVLRLAARHTEPELARRLRQRGDELAERAWRDLLGFESRHVTRAVAVMMTEGCTDLWFRAEAAEPAPACGGTHRFPPKPPFVPQKKNVLGQLRSPGKMLAAARRALRFAHLRGLIDARRSEPSQ